MKLLQPYTLGSLKLKNRMVMAAMTRSRADSDGIVGAITAEYYAQRASAGLILSEAVNISADALGSPLTPGLFTAAQIAAWKKVTRAVHEKGGLIFAQLWHTGRVAHSVDRNGILPAAPSAVKIDGMQHFTSQGAKDFETPRELSADEIRQIIADYAQAAKNAIAAGFDGVELHAANGYPTPPTCAKTNTAAAWKTKPASRWMPCARLSTRWAAGASASKSARCTPTPASPLITPLPLINI